MLPLGGPKGFGLAFIVDLFSALGGAHVSPEIHPLYGERSIPQKLGFSVIAVDAAMLGGADVFHARLQRLVDAVHAAGGDDVPAPMIPGEPEQRHEQEAKGQLRLSDEDVAELDGLARAYELPLPFEVS